MDFNKYYNDLMLLKGLCDDVNSGSILREHRADTFRLKSDAKHFFTVDETNNNMWVGGESIPFNSDEWSGFWRVTKEVFPLFSVNLQDTIEASQFIEKYVFIKIENFYLNNIGFFSPNSKRVLEIGCGYGGVGKYLIEDKNVDYYAIDYCLNCDELMQYKDANGNERFIEIDTSGIPNNLKNKKFGFVYSSNVFQHITHQQKIDYFNEINKILCDDGLFYFDVFSWNYEHNPQIRDGYSCKFFIVETKIETEEEIEKMLNECGFTIILRNKNVFKVNSDCENKPIGYYCIKL